MTDGNPKDEKVDKLIKQYFPDDEPLDDVDVPPPLRDIAISHNGIERDVVGVDLARPDSTSTTVYSSIKHDIESNSFRLNNQTAEQLIADMNSFAETSAKHEASERDLRDAVARASAIIEEHAYGEFWRQHSEQVRPFGWFDWVRNGYGSTPYTALSVYADGDVLENVAREDQAIRPEQLTSQQAGPSITIQDFPGTANRRALVNVNLAQIDEQISGLNLGPARSTAPDNPSVGDAYYNTVEEVMYAYTGEEWSRVSSMSGVFHEVMDGINKLMFHPDMILRFNEIMDREFEMNDPTNMTERNFVIEFILNGFPFLEDMYEWWWGTKTPEGQLHRTLCERWNERHGEYFQALFGMDTFKMLQLQGVFYKQRHVLSAFNSRGSSRGAVVSLLPYMESVVQHRMLIPDICSPGFQIGQPVTLYDLESKQELFTTTLTGFEISWNSRSYDVVLRGVSPEEIPNDSVLKLTTN